MERTTSQPPELSVIVSTPDDPRDLARLFEDLGQLALNHEVIVAHDGRDAAVPAAIPAGRGRLVPAPGDRSAQLAAGARAAGAPVLFFVYGGARLRFHALRALERIVRMERAGAHVFRLRVEGEGARYRMMEWLATARAKLAGKARGYQGLVVRRDDLEKAGGYPQMAKGADESLVGALRRITDIRLLGVTISVPAEMVDEAD